MPATVASRRVRQYCSAVVAVAIALLGTGIAGSASSADPGAAADRPATASPIKHVIVVIGENQTSITSTAPMFRRAGIRFQTFWSKASCAQTARRGPISPKHSS